jgi:ABC-2 type transport system ATP-binding protein
VGNAIEVAGVSKRFRLFHEKYQSFKERAIHLGRVPHEDFWALRDIDLNVAQGETIGLIGRNGSGKSTLLKCMAGILQPTEGTIRTEGRLAALLELGAGFHPELTGRENVFLNASILGLSKKDTERRFDEIVAFAELEAFIDNQVKHYSSGMYVRLGFAVAVNMEPDILLVDEVLAVGDEAFQRKCMDRVKRFQREGRTIVFVTHDVERVRQICDRATVLEEGRMISLGPTGEAIRALREHLFDIGDADVADDDDSAEGMSAQEKRRNLLVRITSVDFDHPGRSERPYLISGEPLTITLHYEAREPVEDVVMGIGVFDLQGREMFGSNTDILGYELPTVAGQGRVVFRIPKVPFLDGTYMLTIGVHSRDEGTVYDWSEQRHSFEVMHPGRSSGMLDLGIEVHAESDGAPAEADR